MGENGQDIDALVAEYLAGGGRIRSIPDAKPATPGEVLAYLEERNIAVEVVMPKNARGATKYRYNSQLLTWDELVQLANGRRGKQHLPPFGK